MKNMCRYMENMYKYMENMINVEINVGFVVQGGVCIEETQEKRTMIFA